VSASLWLQVATAAAVIFAVAIFATLFYLRHRDRQAELAGVEMHVSPYVRRPALLSAAERLHARLHQAVGTDLLICPKVRLAGAIEVRGDAMKWQAAWNRIAAKQVDFLLVAPETYQPLLAILLDDGSRRDEATGQALVAAGLPVLRIRARNDYDPAAIRREIQERMVLPYR